MSRLSAEKRQEMKERTRSALNIFQFTVATIAALNKRDNPDRKLASELVV